MAKRLLFAWLLTLAGGIPTAAALSLQGETDYAAIAHLNAATQGLVKTINVKTGQRVSKGDVLIVLDDTTQQALLKRARAIAQALKPDVTIAALELERAQELYALDSLSQVDLQNAENKLARAEGEYAAAEADAAIAAYHLQQTRIKAPFDGRVLAIHTNQSAYVDPAVETARLVTMADTRRLLVKAAITPQQWSATLANKPAKLSYQGTTYRGTVSHVDLQGQQQGDGSLRYRVHASFDTAQLIPAGMPVTLDIAE